MEQSLRSRIGGGSLDGLLPNSTDLGNRPLAPGTGFTDTVDFVNAFWMAHEVSNSKHFLKEAYSFLKKGGHLFIAEPRFHVSKKSFDRILAIAKNEGFKLISQPSVKFSRTAVFCRC